MKYTEDQVYDSYNFLQLIFSAIMNIVSLFAPKVYWMQAFPLNKITNFQNIPIQKRDPLDNISFYEQHDTKRVTSD